MFNNLYFNNPYLYFNNSNGDDWLRLRKAVRQKLLKPKEVSCFIDGKDKVARNAVDFLPNYLKEDGTAFNLHQFVSRWILECKFILIQLILILEVLVLFWRIGIKKLEKINKTFIFQL